MRLQDIMVTNVVTVGSKDSIAYAARRMREGNVGNLIVTDNGHVKGIITAGDLVMRCLSHEHDPRQCLVAHHMSSPLATASPSTDVASAARQMSEKRIRCLPVMDDGRLTGVVSFSDIARAADQLIRELHDVLIGVSLSRWVT